MVGDFGWEHEGTKSRVGTVKVLTLGTLCTLVSTMNVREAAALI